jgi:LPS export ABC transporter protein LptC
VSGQLGGLAALALLAVLSWWLASERDSTPPPRPVAAPAELGYYLRDATIEETDPDGRLLLHLETNRIDEDPRTGEAALGPLTASYTRHGSFPWLLSADTGQLSADGRALTLRGHVALAASPGAAAGALAGARMETTELAVDAATSEANTDAPVRIELGTKSVTATGMRADLKQQRLWLQSAVHGHFTP